MPDDTSTPAELPEGWEEWLAFLSAQLPEPVERVEEEDGAVMFLGGDPGEVVARLTPEALDVAAFASQPDGRGARAVPRWVGRVYWPRMPGAKAIAVAEALIDAARAARRVTFRTCEWCDRTLPPEAMRDATTCHACAERERSVPI